MSPIPLPSQDVRAMTGRVLGDEVELNLPGGAGQLRIEPSNTMILDIFSGILWDFIGFYGILWDFMGFNGFLCVFLGFYRILWHF